MFARQGLFGCITIVIASCACVILTESAHAQDYPNNEIPMYGGIEKRPDELAADQRLIDRTVAMVGSRAAASDGLVDLAWVYYFRGDLATAIKRFNQAWILDPENGDAFHGFAVVVMERDHDPEQANEFFRDGLEKPRRTTAIHVAYGRFLVQTGRSLDAVPVLRRTAMFPDAGPDAQGLLALALFNANDVEAFCIAANRVEENTQAEIKRAIRSILLGEICQ